MDEGQRYHEYPGSDVYRQRGGLWTGAGSFILFLKHLQGGFHVSYGAGTNCYFDNPQMIIRID